MLRNIAQSFKRQAVPFGYKKLKDYGSDYLSSRKKVVLKLMAHMGFDAEKPDAFIIFSILIFHKMVKNAKEGKYFPEIKKDNKIVQAISSLRADGRIEHWN